MKLNDSGLFDWFRNYVERVGEIKLNDPAWV